MTTITAVELRNNLEDIVKRAMAGETFRVTYRRDKVLRLTADKPKELPKRMSGLDAFNKAPRKGYKYDETKSWKELYGEMLEEKYGTTTK